VSDRPQDIHHSSTGFQQRRSAEAFGLLRSAEVVALLRLAETFARLPGAVDALFTSPAVAVDAVPQAHYA
jgi:hypothetical protein